jgi:hypothetical protein
MGEAYTGISGPFLHSVYSACYAAKVMKILEQSNKTMVFHMVGITGSVHSSGGGATLRCRRDSRCL